MMPSENLQEQLENIPQDTGVYQYFDKEGKFLYVGKAKNLKKRVSSYFNKKQEDAKTRALVRKIAEIQTIVVASEIDALLLENNLIKKYQPRYNVMLKDDKTYPWICISNEEIPRVFQTRKMKKNDGLYYGPYQSTKITRQLLSFFSDLFYANGWTPMTYLNRVIFNESEKLSYLGVIEEIKKILSGKVSVIVKALKKDMNRASKKLEFEKAFVLKQKLDLLEKYQHKSVIVNPKINNVDVFSIVSNEKFAYVNYFKVVGGAIIQSHSLELKKKLAENDEDLLVMAITELRNRFQSTSKECYTCIPISSVWENFNITVPKIGDKRKLVELSYRNAKHLQMERLHRNEKNKNRHHNKRLMEQMQNDLHLKAKPTHIECFDNSNIHGSNPVAACVVFKNGKPSKKEYRHFNIKTVDGPDDFASMEEVVYRRYSRLVKEKRTLPQLIIIDGGKGQLSSAVKSLELLGLMGKIAIIGIAKKLEEIYFPNDSVPLYLDKRSETLKVIQQARNEAHRFGINHHRNQRSKDALNTSLDDIPGIGPKTIQKLVAHFGSVKRVLEADEKDLINLVGEKKTKLLRNKV